MSKGNEGFEIRLHLTDEFANAVHENKNEARFESLKAALASHGMKMENQMWRFQSWYDWAKNTSAEKEYPNDLDKQSEFNNLLAMTERTVSNPAKHEKYKKVFTLASQAGDFVSVEKATLALRDFMEELDRQEPLLTEIQIVPNAPRHPWT